MRYKVQFELVLDDNDPSIPEWILDAVYSNLHEDEQVENFVVEQVN